MKIKTLQGHNSFETAYEIADYPYGFQLRCKKRIWIEDGGKKGQRVVSQTTNPKRGDTWNTPKKSTFSMLKVLFIDEKTGYVECDGFNSISADRIMDFKKYELDERGTKFLEAAERAARKAWPQDWAKYDAPAATV